jgi:hypothetical protein
MPAVSGGPAYFDRDLIAFAPGKAGKRVGRPVVEIGCKLKEEMAE